MRNTDRILEILARNHANNSVKNSSIRLEIVVRSFHFDLSFLGSTSRVSLRQTNSNLSVVGFNSRYPTSPLRIRFPQRVHLLEVHEFVILVSMLLLVNLQRLHGPKLLPALGIRANEAAGSVSDLAVPVLQYLHLSGIPFSVCATTGLLLVDEMAYMAGLLLE